jgi:hypothetical protein
MLLREHCARWQIARSDDDDNKAASRRSGLGRFGRRLRSAANDDKKRKQ